MSQTPSKLGKYDIIRAIGNGAMGVVYEGFDSIIERTVAIKTIKKDELDPEDAEEHSRRFLIEAKAAGKLNHPNIVGIYDYGDEQGLAYIVMEYVQGKELKSYFDAKYNFNLSQTQRLMTELLEALGYSHHRGVIHRDIKPANLFVTEGGMVKLGDFGIARIDSSQKTHAGTVLGTPSYMSPEQIRGEVVDARSDLYSAGVILYQFLVGERPFSGNMVAIMQKVLAEPPPPPSSKNPSISPALDAVIAKALAKSADDRYQNAAEFASGLAVAIKASAEDEDGESTVVFSPKKARAPTSASDSTGSVLTQSGTTGTGTGTGKTAGTGTGASTGSAVDQLRRQAEEAKRRAEEEMRQLEEQLKHAQAQEEQAQREAEQRAKEEAEARARLEAEQKAEQERLRLEALERERLEAERKAAEQRAKEEAEARARQEAEKRAEQERLRLEAEEKAKQERLRLEALERERIEAERKAAEQKAAELKAAEQRAAEQRAQAEAEARARQEAEEKAKQERLRLEALERERIEAERKAAEQQAAELKAAEQRAKQEEQARAQQEAEQKAEQERLRLEALERERIEAERKAAEQKAAEQRAKAEQEKSRNQEEATLLKAPANPVIDSEQTLLKQPLFVEPEVKPAVSAPANKAGAKPASVHVPAATSSKGSSNAWMIPAGIGGVVILGAAAWWFTRSPSEVQPATETPPVSTSPASQATDPAVNTESPATMPTPAPTATPDVLPPAIPEPAQQPDKPKDKPADKPADKPKDKAADKPKDKAADKPAEVVTPKPVPVAPAPVVVPTPPVVPKPAIPVPAPVVPAPAAPTTPKATPVTPADAGDKPEKTASPSELYREGLALIREGRGKEGVRMLEQAGNAGNGAASKRLMEIYSGGDSGVSQDYGKAVKWKNKAKSQGVDVSE